MIEVENLTKQYGETVAVRDLSFNAEPGRIFGLLGPNGAGKSTTIGCISGLLAPTSGRVRVLGHDVVTDGVKSRRELGVVPQELALYEELSARENLVFWGSAYGLRGSALRDRVAEVLREIGLYDRAGETVKTYSGGMKRRLNFGCGVVHQPRVLLLDEPTVGVDPQSRERLLDLVRAQVGLGTCVLYTTHYMEEAETLCDELAIIDHGEIVAAGTLADLRGILGERDVLKFSGAFDEDRIHAVFAGANNREILALDEANLQLAVAEAPRHLSDIIERLTETGAVIEETTLSRASLESLFIKLTGKELRE